MQNVEKVTLAGIECLVFSRGRKHVAWYVTVPDALYGPLAIRETREEAVAQATEIILQEYANR